MGIVVSEDQGCSLVWFWFRSLSPTEICSCAFELYEILPKDAVGLWGVGHHELVIAFLQFDFVVVVGKKE